MKKRILSIVLTLILLVSSIPLPALAAGQSEPVNLGRTASAKMCEGSCPSGEGINNAFDGDRTNTKWCMSGNGWMFFTLSDPALLKYMRIYHAGSSDNETCPYNTVAFDLEVLNEDLMDEDLMQQARFPRDRINDDNHWTKVASVTDNLNSITTTPVSMTESRTMFRLNITDAGRDDTVRIYEIELFDTDPTDFQIDVDGAQASVDGKPVTSARPGETVTVTADSPSSPDLYFSHWGTTSPENLVLSEPLSPTTTFIMPEHDVYLSTEYSHDTARYKITVDGGTATFHGTPVTAVPNNVNVVLTADPAPEGQTFAFWKNADVYYSTIDYYTSTVTIHIHNHDVHLKAIYKDAITQVSVSDLTLPSRGAAPDFEVTLPPDAPYHLATVRELDDRGYNDDLLRGTRGGVAWRLHVWDAYLLDGDTFDNAKEDAYYAQIALLPNEDYAFTEDAAVTLNGGDSLIEKVQFKKDVLWIDTKLLTAHLADPTERALTVENGTATVYGETVTTAPGGVTVKLTADPAPEGQVFSYWEVVSDNIIVDPTPSYKFIMPTEAVHVRAVYGKPIKSVSVSDLTMPVLTAHPDFEVTIPQDAPYHLATPQDLKRYEGSRELKDNNYHGVWWIDSTGSITMTPESTFYNPAQGQYSAWVLLAPNEGYAFTSETTVVINGDSQLGRSHSPRYAIVAATHPLTAAPGPVMDYAVDVEGGTASVDGTAVTSAHVGSAVTLTAEAPEGQVFDHWEVLSGHVKLDRPRNSSVTFTMFSEDFRAKAVYKTLITEVAILDLTMPVLGQHPDFEVTLPPDVPYHLATPQELASFRGRDAKYNHNSVWWTFDYSREYLTPEFVFDRTDVDDYCAEIALVPNEGYVFPHDGFIGQEPLDATINGGTSLLYGFSPMPWLLTVTTKPVSAAPAPAKEYTITVDKGTASVDGIEVTSALAGTTVQLFPEQNTDEQYFDHWEVVSGDVTLSSADFVGPTFTMPAGDVHVKAVYNIPIKTVFINDLNLPVLDERPDFEVTLPKDAPYHLASRQELKDNNYVDIDSNYNGVYWNSNGGKNLMTPDSVFTQTDEGAYNAQIVLIPNEGYSFTSPIGATINGSPTLVQRTFGTKNFNSITTIPLTASPAPVPEYAVTVTDGTASVGGNPVTTALADTIVTLTADSAPSGQVFDHWEVTGGEITLADGKEPSTTFTMPAMDVAVKAVYKELPPVQEPIQVEFINKGLFGQRVIPVTIPVDGSIQVPAPGVFSRRCWLSADESTALFGGERLHYATALALQSTCAREDGVIPFYAVAEKNLPVNQKVTIRFLDGQQEVGRASQTVRLHTESMTCAEVLPYLPDGYVFADNQDQSIQDNTVTFQVEAISAETSAPIQLTLKLRSICSLENGKKSMTVPLAPGESLVMPGAQRRNGTTYDVLWSYDQIQVRSGDTLSYEVLMQYLSSLPETTDNLVIRGKIIRG